MSKPKKLPVAISVEEFTNLMRVTTSPTHRVAFLLGFGAGLRISEITHLEKRDFDFQGKKILVRQGKGSKDRVVPLPKSFRRSYLEEIPIKIGVRALQKGFKSSANAFRLILDKPTIHFHSLRHGFATRLAEKGTPVHLIKGLMGHSNISTTNVYLEVNPQEALKWYEEKF